MSQPMNVEVKRINRLDGEGAGKAFCDVVIAESILIKGFKVVEGKKGLFVSMPQQKGKDGQWYDTVIPLTKETRQQIFEVVLQAYQSGAELPPDEQP